MSIASHVLQDPFLNALRKQRCPVAIYLTNGIKLQGVVSSFDQNVILLRNNTKQMVYKHAVATVVPSRNIIWNDSEEGSSEAGQIEEDDLQSIENF